MQIPISVHGIGPAEGTQPQPIKTEIKNRLAGSCYLSERNWSTEMIQARKQNCQMTSPGKSSPEAA
jgi:hypothetical protein